MRYMNPQKREKRYISDEMKNKKIVIVGCSIIFLCLAFVLFLGFSSDIFGAVKRANMVKQLKSMESIEYVLINDNRSENYFGGEYIETDREKCLELKSLLLGELVNASCGGTRENFLGGFCLIVRISDGEDELKLWFYDDKIEIENGIDVVICKTEDSSAYLKLLSLTEK